ncbi:UNVERIFIED_CONTAM: hypothetical protein O8I53_11125 [Campylobacter lari]
MQKNESLNYIKESFNIKSLKSNTNTNIKIHKIRIPGLSNDELNFFNEIA